MTANVIILQKTEVCRADWLDSKGKKYYLDPDNGSAATVGLLSVDRVTYYFNAKGVMQKNKAVTIDGVVYKPYLNGRMYLANIEDKDDDIPDKMLFFTTCLSQERQPMHRLAAITARPAENISLITVIHCFRL